MDHIKAHDELCIIEGLLNDWQTRGSIGTLEYELLLDKIKLLYETVRFGNIATEQESASLSHVHIKDTAPSEPHHIPEEGTPQPDGPTGHSCTDRTEGHESDSLPQEEERTTLRQSPNRSATVRALYSDEPQHIIKTSAVSPEVPATDTSNAQHVPASSGRTLADTLPAPHTDMAAILGHGKHASLKGSIGLNDRYMFINELFGGDTAAYEAAMTTLESFTSMDEALLYINDNFGWHSDNAAATRLVDLLAMKLMNP